MDTTPPGDHTAQPTSELDEMRGALLEHGMIPAYRKLDREHDGYRFELVAVKAYRGPSDVGKGTVVVLAVESLKTESDLPASRFIMRGEDWDAITHGARETLPQAVERVGRAIFDDDYDRRRSTVESILAETGHWGPRG